MHFLNAVLHLEGENRIKSVGHLKPAIKMRNLAGKKQRGRTPQPHADGLFHMDL